LILAAEPVTGMGAKAFRVAAGCTGWPGVLPRSGLVEGKMPQSSGVPSEGRAFDRGEG